MQHDITNKTTMPTTNMGQQLYQFKVQVIKMIHNLVHNDDHHLFAGKCEKRSRLRTVGIHNSFLTQPICLCFNMTCIPYIYVQWQA